MTGRRASLGRGAQRERRLDARRVGAHVVAQAVQRDRRCGHRVADHHPADRNEVARLGREDSEGDDEAQGGRGRQSEGDEERQERAGDPGGAAAGGERADERHRDQKGDHESEAILLEHDLDDVADRAELHEGARRGDDDVVLQSSALPCRDHHGKRRQCE